MIKGLNNVLRNIARMSEKKQKQAKFAISDEADIIFAKSMRLVPLDEGILKSTGHVKFVGTKDNPAYKISYGGGPATSYAIRQHEDYSLKHTPPHQANYLGQPFNEALPGLTNRLAIRIKKVL